MKKKSAINAAWHEAHPMPKRPTPGQRLAWHLEHQKRCACRPVPASLRTAAAAATSARPARKSAGKAASAVRRAKADAPVTADEMQKPAGGGAQRYAAFLRGVSPMNAKMPELKRCFEEAGFTEVKTLLSSGNVVFSARPATNAVLEKKAEAAMKARLGRTFMTIVRPVDELRALLESEPYAKFRLAPGSKRVVTFFREAPKPKPKLPIELHGARILSLGPGCALSSYVPGPRGPVFMTLLEKTFGVAITTRTWDTVAKSAR